MRVAFDYFEMPVNSSLQNTHEVRYHEGQGFVVTRPEYNTGPLSAQDVVAAREELRGKIWENDIPYDPEYWYTLTDGVGGKYSFRIREATSDHIFIWGVDAWDTQILRPCHEDPPTMEFLRRIRESGLCSHAELNDDLQAHVILTPEVARSPHSRSAAHEAILTLLPGRS